MPRIAPRFCPGTPWRARSAEAHRWAKPLCRPAAGAGLAGQGVHVGLLVFVQAQGSHQRGQHRGRRLLAPLLQARVVINADRGELSHLLSAQPGDAALELIADLMNKVDACPVGAALSDDDRRNLQIVLDLISLKPPAGQ